MAGPAAAVTRQNSVKEAAEKQDQTLNRQLEVVKATIKDVGVIGVESGWEIYVAGNGGIKAEEATTDELFSSMHHPYSQALLASMPNLENATKHELSSIAGLPPDLSKEIVGCRFAPRCSYATDQCRTEQPGLTKTGNRAYACFHPVEGPKPIVIRSAAQASAATVSKIFFIVFCLV